VLWLPLIGAALSLLGFGLLVGGSAWLTNVDNRSPAFEVAGILAATFIGTGVTAFTSVAVATAATSRMDGVTPAVGASLSKAWQRRRLIIEWTVLAFGVGTVLRLVERRLGGVGGGIFSIVGSLAWGVATFLVVPILAFEDVGPIQAVKRSSRLIEQHFGTVGRGALRFGFVFVGWGLAAAAIILVGLVLILGGRTLGFPIVVVGVLALFLIIEVAIAVGVYLRTILYRFTTGQPLPDLGLELSKAFGGDAP